MNAEQRHTVIKPAECDHSGEIESIHDKAGLLFQREMKTEERDLGAVGGRTVSEENFKS